VSAGADNCRTGRLRQPLILKSRLDTTEVQAIDTHLVCHRLIANNVGGGEPLQLDPVSGWTATLTLAVALDLNRPRPELGRGRA